jgi:hypothetical protein
MSFWISFEEDSAFVWLKESSDDLDGGRLSRTVWPKIADDFTRLNMEADVLD